MKTAFIVALGMMLLLEGIIPFLFPRQWRNTVIRIAQFSDGQIRFFGLTAVLGGLTTLGAYNLFF